MLQTKLLVLLACIVIAKCEITTSVLPRMVGGQETVAGFAPSVVSIRIPRHVANAPEAFCGGTIINLNHILTSVQCVHNETFQLLNPSEFRIVAGDLNIMLPTFRRFTTSASHIYTHPSYTVNPRSNDIAVMRTSTPFPSPHNTIDFSARSTRVLPNGHACRFVGWSSATATGILNPAQQFIPANIFDRGECNGPNVHRGLVLDNMICAGSLTVTPSVCTGNLGGGLFCQVGNEWQLTGVLSFGIGCGVINTPGVYTQVRFFETWINQQLTRTDATPAGSLVYA
ncbi:trypsin alpha-3-like [Bradysia coprophila]|uniref:trypsin alpha-3-like n=1 Tax=Bradysia coprophila TaxID=38358 RepID=UPI00187DD52F|nr:trypsin alpha-3-like [Bradysia coprophila]